MFPLHFYASFDHGQWSFELGGLDFALPERLLTSYAAKNDIAILPLGGYMRDNGLDVETIQTLYFSGGRGHFTPAGHEFLAGAIHDAFYRH
jgi:hypothetical protein